MDPARTLIDSLIQQSTSAGTNPAATAAVGQSSATLMQPLDRHLYANPTAILPISMNAMIPPLPAILNAAAAAGGSGVVDRQFIYDLPISCTTLPRVPQPSCEPQSRPSQISRRPHVATNSSYNQLKDTVVRAQQRKRQRENDDQTGYQSLVVAAAAAAVASSSASDPTPDSTENEDRSRRMKIQRREEATSSSTSGLHHQNQNHRRCATTASASSSSSSSLASSSSASNNSTAITNNNSNNQQITGTARQHEPRNCHFCSPNVVQNPVNVQRRDVIAPIPHIYQPNSTEQLFYMRQAFLASQIVPTAIMTLQSQVRALQDAMIGATVPTMPPPMPIRPIPTNLYMMGSHPVVSDVHLMLGYLQQTTDSLIRDRITLDRHHMFAGSSEDIPIGANVQEIEKNTKRMIFEKGEKEEEADETERCTVCLSDFEAGKEVRLLQCSHIFHPECIDKWLFYNKKCPVCRMDVDKKKLEANESSTSASDNAPAAHVIIN